MRVIIILFAACFFCIHASAQESKRDTINQTFLYEDDYRLTMNTDAILRPQVFILNHSENKLKDGYKKGLFLFGDSLSLGNYRLLVTQHGYKIMQMQQFQNLLAQIVNEKNNIIEIEGYRFQKTKLKLVIGYLGMHNMNVMWNADHMRLKKLPVYYIEEIL